MYNSIGGQDSISVWGKQFDPGKVGFDSYYMWLKRESKLLQARNPSAFYEFEVPEQ